MISLLLNARNNTAPAARARCQNSHLNTQNFFDMKFDFHKNKMMQDGKVVSGSLTLDSKAVRAKIKNENLHLIRSRDLDELCERPRPGEQWRMITEKKFNAYALILSAINAKADIEEMYLAIYRINQPTVASLTELITDGKIKKANFIISNFFQASKRPEKWANQLRAFSDMHPNCRHAYVNNHSKVLLLKTADGDHLVFEGSGNMSDNARIEQYLYENNEMIYNFHKEWMDEVIEKHE